MAFQYFLAIKGSKQGQFKPSTTKGSQPNDKWLECISFEMGTISPRDVGTGNASGKRTHKPIVITRETDSASPLLFQMCVSNELLTEVLIEERLQGHPSKTITLSDAVLIKCGSSPKLPHGAVAGKHYTALEFNFQKIDIENVSGGKTATDDWTASA